MEALLGAPAFERRVADLLEALLVDRGLRVEVVGVELAGFDQLGLRYLIRVGELAFEDRFAGELLFDEGREYVDVGLEIDCVVVGHGTERSCASPTGNW